MAELIQLQEEARQRHLSPQVYFDMVMSAKISRSHAERVLQRAIKLRNREVEDRRKEEEKENHRKYIAEKNIKKEKRQAIIAREKIADDFKEVLEMAGLSLVYFKRYKPEREPKPVGRPKKQKPVRPPLDLSKIKKFAEARKEVETIPTPVRNINFEKIKNYFQSQPKEFKRPPAIYTNRSAIDDYL